MAEIEGNFGSAQFFAFVAASEGESDRGLALLAAEHVHSTLADLLSAATIFAFSVATWKESRA